jgi:TM2 domain-containing membrane protein YozV
MDEKYCVACGKPIPEMALFCPLCGASQNPGGQPPPPHYAAPSTYAAQQTANTVHGRDKWIAAVLAFFLGGFGVHKFYLGKTAQGILYLLFFWTIIPGIIAFIEFIIYSVTPEEVFRARYPYN